MGGSWNGNLISYFGVSGSLSIPSSHRSTFDYQTFFLAYSLAAKIAKKNILCRSTLLLAASIYVQFEFFPGPPHDSTHSRASLRRKIASSPRITRTKLSRFLHFFLVHSFFCRRSGLFAQSSSVCGEGRQREKNCVQYFLCLYGWCLFAINEFLLLSINNIAKHTRKYSRPRPDRKGLRAFGGDENNAKCFLWPRKKSVG